MSSLINVFSVFAETNLEELPQPCMVTMLLTKSDRFHPHKPNDILKIVQSFPFYLLMNSAISSWTEETQEKFSLQNCSDKISVKNYRLLWDTLLNTFLEPNWLPFSFLEIISWWQNLLEIFISSLVTIFIKYFVSSAKTSFSYEWIAERRSFI